MRYDLHISHYIVLDQGHNPKRAQSLIRGKQMKMNICCPIFIAMLTNIFSISTHKLKPHELNGALRNCMVAISVNQNGNAT